MELLDYIQTPARQARVVEDVAHRPWPLPQGTWLQAQTWDFLLFAHWRVDADSLRALVPEPVPVDEFDGSAWLGVTPFCVNRARLRGTLPIPVASSFLEINVRTYATIDGKPGIWFFSLDANSPLIVEGARRTYRLPYYRARISADVAQGRTRFGSDRAGASFDATYGPAGPIERPVAGTLEHFLTERYCLYTMYRNEVHIAEIHHPPWPLQAAEAEIRENTMSPVALKGEPLLHYSERQDVVIWPLGRLR